MKADPPSQISVKTVKNWIWSGLLSYIKFMHKLLSHAFQTGENFDYQYYDTHFYACKTSAPTNELTTYG